MGGSQRKRKEKGRRQSGRQRRKEEEERNMEWEELNYKKLIEQETHSDR